MCIKRKDKKLFNILCIYTHDWVIAHFILYLLTYFLQINFNFLRLHKQYPQVTEQGFGSQNIILSAADSKAETRFLYPAVYLS